MPISFLIKSSNFSVKNEVLRNSKSVGAIVRNNLRSKDRSRSADVRIKSVTRSVPLLSALTLKSALIGDSKSKNTTKTNLKMKKKNNKQSKRQLMEKTEQTKESEVNVVSAVAETKENDENDDEKALNETIKREYLNFKSLEKRNQQEREKLNDLMKKLNDELITAQIDLMKEDYLVNNNNDLQTTLQYRKQILEAASTTSTNSTGSNKNLNKIIQLQQFLKLQKDLKKTKSKRRHTISSTRDHLPLNDLLAKAKQDSILIKKINESERLAIKASPVINDIKKPKIVIVQNEQNGNISVIKNSKFKSLSNIHNQPELSSISSYSSSIVPSTSSSSASTTSTTSSKCVFYNNDKTQQQQQQQQQQEEQKFCNMFKDSIRLNNNNLVDQFESLI